MAARDAVHKIQCESQPDNKRNNACRCVSIYAESDKDPGQHEVILFPILEAAHKVVESWREQEREEGKSHPDPSKQIGPEGDSGKSHRGQTCPLAADFLAK